MFNQEILLYEIKEKNKINNINETMVYYCSICKLLLYCVEIKINFVLSVERVSRCVCNTDRKRRTEIKIGHRMQAVKRTQEVFVCLWLTINDSNMIRASNSIWCLGINVKVRQSAENTMPKTSCSKVCTEANGFLN